MSFVNIARRWLSRGKQNRGTSEPGFQVMQLDDRITPSSTMLDHSSDFLTAGNGTSELLGTSQDGRYVIFGSTSTNLVPGQISSPGTENLFWADLLTGNIQLVTNLPTVDTSGAVPKYNFDGATTYSRILPAQKEFGQAVISADGQFVAFSTKLDAKYVDFNYVTPDIYAPSKRTTDPDSNNATYDVFRWAAKFDTTDPTQQKVSLVSRTYNGVNYRSPIPSQAVGRTSDATDPAISSDGTFVTFVSSRDAGTILPQRDPILSNFFTTTDLNFIHIVRDDNASPDIFVTDMNGAADSGGYYNDTGNTQFKTSIMTQIVTAPLTITYPTSAGTATTSPTTATITVNQYRAIGSLGSGAVSFDPYGRYLDGTGTNITITSTLDPAFLSNSAWLSYNTRTYASTANLTTSSNRDVYLLSNTTTSNLANTVRLVTATASTTTAGPVQSLARAGGNAENAIIAQGDGTLILFVATDTASGQLIKGVSNGGNAQLYERSMSSELGDTPILISSASKAPTATTPYVVGGRLQLNSDTPAPAIGSTSSANLTNPLGYSFTPDGRYVTFTNSSPANTLSPVNAALGQTLPVNDNNNALDIFVKDTVTGRTTTVSVLPTPRPGQPFQTGKGSAINPRISATGRYVTFQSVNTDYVALADGNGTGTQANGNGLDAFVRDVTNSNTVLLNIASTSSSDVGTVSGQVYVGDSVSAGYATFASAATNIDTRFAGTKGNVSIYLNDLQPVTSGKVNTSQKQGVITSSGQVAMVTYSTDGKTVVGNRYTPFPGFNGEIRAVLADVNGDGVLDVIAAEGPAGQPRVAVIDGSTGSVLSNFLAYESSFSGGVYVAAADLDGDGKSEIITGAGESGGPRIRIFRGSDLAVVVDFFAFESTFRGGARVATGDVGSLSSAGTGIAVADSISDVIVAAGEGGGPRVTVYDGFSFVGYNNFTNTGATVAPSNLWKTPRANSITDFFAYEQGLRNGAYVAAGDFTGGGLADIVTGAGPDGGPRVKVFNTQTVIATPSAPSTLVDFFAGDITSRAGIRVAVKNISNATIPDIMTGDGFSLPPTIRTFAASRLSVTGQPTQLDQFLALDNTASFSGAWVG